MRKILMLLAGTAALALTASASAQDLGGITPDPVTLNIPNVAQENEFWYWAALANQLINWRGLGQGPSQCEIVNIANTYKGEQMGDCCENPAAPECSRPGDENELQNIVGLYGGTIREVPTPQTPEEIYGHLLNRQALLALVQYEGDEGLQHMYMVRGIEWEGGEAVLLINDPAVPQSQKKKFSEAQETWFQVFLAD